MTTRRRQITYTNAAERWHYCLDMDATKFDGFEVEVVPLYPTFIFGDEPLEELWSRAVATAVHFRKLYHQHVRLYPADVFDPFAFITAVDREREVREQRITTAMLVGNGHPDAVERVRALCEAHDLATGRQGLPSPVPWPKLRALE